MIRHISIKDFAIIENVEIDFHDGLNIITGETGAGKSIVIEAVSLALGSRADTAFIRSGKEKAVIQMIADLNGTEYIISREISSSGRNICRINDEIVTLTRLGDLCRKLADIHGQYDHQSLLDPENHIKLVDLYHKETISPLRKDVSEAYEDYSALRARLKALLTEAAKDRRQRDFMQFEFDELTAAGLMSGEDTELEERVKLLQNSEKIYENLSGAYYVASGDDRSVLSSLKQISDMISGISSYSGDLGTIDSRLNELYFEFEDIASSIRDCRDNAVFSPEELDAAINRLETVNKLKAKHGKTLDELIAYRDELDEKLAAMDDMDSTKSDMERELSARRHRLLAACGALSEARKASAAELEEKISAELEELNFNDAGFSIEFRDADVLTSGGADTVEFLIATNRGEPLKPLSRIASGGEMSRIMLAFKKIIGDYDDIPTMIFDEIDSGISGITASIVGRKLKDISRTHQIICITHLPQIAACGDHNYRISKESDDAMTYTTVLPLSHDEKVAEIARLLGGSNITETTLKSAEELIAASK